LKIKIKCKVCKKTVNSPIVKKWFFPNRQGEGKIWATVRINGHKKGLFKRRCKTSGRRFKTVIGYQSDPQGTGSGVEYYDNVN